MPLIPAEYGRLSAHEPRPWGSIKSGFTHFADGDVGLAKITPCFQNGKSTVFRGLTGGIGAGTTELHIVRPLLVDPDFILIFLKSPHFIDTGIPLMTGTAGQKRVSTDYFKLTPFPLPPLAEQRRIVTKVDSLMAVCNQLEAAQEERERRRARLSVASLVRLTTPTETPEKAPRQEVTFFLTHSDRIATKPEHVKEVRRAILSLAVQGRLADTTTEWESTTVGALCEFVTSGSRGWAEYYSPSGASFLRAQNVRFGCLQLDDLAHVCPPKGREGTRTRVRPNDIVVVITGAGVTNPALIDIDLGEAYVSQHLGLLRLRHPAYSRWILLWLMAECGARKELTERAYGAGKPGLNLNNLRTLPILIPGLPEQERIVAKVNELMVVCDDLERSLSAAEVGRARALEAVLHELLEEAAEEARDPAPALVEVVG
jgi:type I restriction enzyme S subunit